MKPKSPGLSTLWERLSGDGSGSDEKGSGLGFTVSPIKLETGLRPNSAGIPYTLLLKIEAMGFPTFRLLL